MSPVSVVRSEAEVDREDLLAFLGGDSHAFESIHARHHPALLALCTRYLRDADLAADAVQQAFCAAVPHLPRIAAEGNLAAWLRRTTVNLCIDELRRRARAARIFTPPLGGGAAAGVAAVDSDPRRNPEDALERSQRREEVLAAAARMPDRLRAALVLREMQGLSHRDVSRRLGISLAASEALVYRARARFRREYLSVAGEAHGTPHSGAMCPTPLNARLTGRRPATWSTPRHTAEGQELQHAG